MDINLTGHTDIDLFKIRHINLGKEYIVCLTLRDYPCFLCLSRERLYHIALSPSGTAPYCSLCSKPCG